MSLRNKKIVIGITGGIAVFKIPGLIRLMACDTYGPGRMPEPEEICQLIRKFFEKI